MALTNAFFDAINNENVRRVRIMMKDSLLVDPSFKEFKEMETAATKVPGLYDVHDGREFVNDESAWNDDYMNKQMVQLIGNFSHERIEHLKDVIRVLRPIEHTEGAGIHATGTHMSDSSRSYEEQKRFDKQNGTYKGAVIAGGALVGAVVGGVIAAIAEITVVGGAVAGAAVVGAAVSVAVLGGK